MRCCRTIVMVAVFSLWCSQPTSAARGLARQADEIRSSARQVWKTARKKLPTYFLGGHREERAQELLFLFGELASAAEVYPDIVSQGADQLAGANRLLAKLGQIEPLLTEFPLDRKGQKQWHRLRQRVGVLRAELVPRNGSLDNPVPILANDSPAAKAQPEELMAVDLPLENGFAWPVRQVRILSVFGDSRGRRTHKGLDLGGPAGTPVLAARDGIVSFSGGSLDGYGKTIIIEHSDGSESLYAHNSRLLVSVGEKVKTGDQIALMGRTGNATADHCHFEIRVNRVAQDPLAHLPPR